MNYRIVENKEVLQFNNSKIIQHALSGITGGSLVGSYFDLWGCVIGGIVGATVTGYAEYKSQKKAVTK